MSRSEPNRAMVHLFFPQLHWLGLSAAVIGLLTATAAVTLAHPGSPLCWSALAGTNTVRSSSSVPHVAGRWASPEARADALWQAAVEATGQNHAPKHALALLDRLLREHPSSTHSTSARVQRAMLLERQDDPRAAEAWQAAAQHAPEHPRAGRWWLAAADLYSAGDLPLTALEAYEAATTYPSEAAMAWVAIGRLTLASDAAAAHVAFTQAAAAAQRPSTLRLARLGTATALERLEGPEAALADVDDVIASEGADPSLERRRDRLRNGG